MTPEQFALLQAKLDQPNLGVGAPPVDPGFATFRAKYDAAPGIVDRANESIDRLGRNPVVQAARAGLAPLTLGGTLLGPAIESQTGSAAPGGLADLSRRTQGVLAASAERDARNAPAAPTTIAPIDAPMARVTPAAPLDPRSPAAAAVAAQGQLGAAGGAPTNSLQADVDKARKGGLDTLEGEKDLTRQLGVDEAVKVNTLAALQQAHAERMERDAEIQRQHDADVEAKHAQYLQRNTELADDIAKQQVDPKRLFRDATVGDRFLMALGGMLGGLADRGSGNAYLARMDRMIDQDIEAQRQGIENRKASLSARQGIYGQMLQETGDSRLAAMQTRNLMYEAAKTKLMADADRLGIPSIRTKAEMGANAIQQKQDALNIAYSEQAQKAAAAQAAARASAARAEEEKNWNRQYQLAQLQLEKDKMAAQSGASARANESKIQSEVASASKRLAEDEVVTNEPTIATLQGAIKGEKGHEYVAGLNGPLDDVRAQLGPGGALGIARYTPLALLANKAVGLTGEERIARTNYEQLAKSYQNQVTGAGGNQEEMADIRRAFEGAKTNEERVNAVRKAQAILEKRKALAMAELSDEARPEFLRRMAREGKVPMPAAASGFKRPGEK